MNSRVGCSGFGLIQVMVATGLTGVVGLTIASLVTFMTKSQSVTMERSSAETLFREIGSVLSSRAACTNTFAGTTLNTDLERSISQIRDAGPAPGSVVYSVDSNYGSPAVRLQLLRANGYTADPSTATAGTFLLTVSIQSATGQTGESLAFRERFINIKSERNSANQLVSCIAMANMTDGIWRRSPAALDDIFYEGSSSGGRVGVGLANPSHAFEVAYEVAGGAGAGRGIASYQATNGGQAGLFISKRARGTLASPQPVTNGTRLGSLAHTGYTATGFSAPRQYVYTETAQDWTATANGSRLHLLTTPLNSTVEQERLTISEDGRVGIGTTGPRSTFEVSQDGAWASVGATTYSNDVNQSGVLILSRGRGTRAAPAYPQAGDNLGGVVYRDGIDTFSGTAFGGASVVALASQNFTATAKGTHLSFSTTRADSAVPAERLRITSEGAVGIGNPTPGFKIDVLQPSAPNSKIARFAVSGTSNGFYIEQKTDLSLQHIFEHGHVGIGITNPAYRLQVEGTNLAVATIGISGGNSIRFNGNVIDSLNAAKTGGADLLLNPGGVYSGGNVGVGTASPAAVLDVAGGVRIGTDSRACTPAIGGTVRYNSGSGRMEYCNGVTSSWSSISGKPSCVPHLTCMGLSGGVPGAFDWSSELGTPQLAGPNRGCPADYRFVATGGSVMCGSGDPAGAQAAGVCCTQ